MKYVEGDFFEKKVVINYQMGEKFADVSGDKNPIHLDEDFAEQTRFGKRIVHGMLIGSYFSAIIGNDFPLNGTIYLNQSMIFKNPIYNNSDVIIRIEIKSIDRQKNRLLLSTTCRDYNDKILVDGEALVLYEV
ncbi:MAG: MaoC family dehydratase [Clostridia bacterium]|nr:MaoC family dehydratase [Clostridia bacterium]